MTPIDTPASLNDWHQHVADAFIHPDHEENTMAITPGSPVNRGDGMNHQTDPPFKYEQQQHTGQAMPPEDRHPMNDQQMLDMIHGEQK